MIVRLVLPLPPITTIQTYCVPYPSTLYPAAICSVLWHRFWEGGWLDLWCSKILIRGGGGGPLSFIIFYMIPKIWRGRWQLLFKFQCENIGVIFKFFDLQSFKSVNMDYCTVSKLCNDLYLYYGSPEDVECYPSFIP